MPVYCAASISVKSCFEHCNDLATILPRVVFPQPGGPVNIKECGSFSFDLVRIETREFTTSLLPTKSSRVFGLYLIIRLIFIHSHLKLLFGCLGMEAYNH